MQPASPNPSYDFILNAKQPAPKSGFSLPSMPRPVKIGLAVIVGLLLIITVFSVIGSSKGAKSQPMLATAARATEISRVTAVYLPHAGSANLTNFAQTVTTTMNSAAQQLGAQYATVAHKKTVDPKQLAIDKNPAIDSQLTTAAQNGTADSTYLSYLKTALNTYVTELNAAYSSASASGKASLQTVYSGVQALLADPTL